MARVLMSGGFQEIVDQLVSNPWIGSLFKFIQDKDWSRVLDQLVDPDRDRQSCHLTLRDGFVNVYVRWVLAAALG